MSEFVTLKDVKKIYQMGEVEIMAAAGIDFEIKKGEFAKGSMLPKVEACLKFVDSPNKIAIITSLDEAANALEGKNGTRITFN